MSEDRRLAVAGRVLAAQKCFRLFDIDGRCWANPASERAMQEAESAFAKSDYDRAEHLAEVVLAMLRRDSAKYNANPEAWIARMREQAETQP
jgi:hypothetical protein